MDTYVGPDQAIGTETNWLYNEYDIERLFSGFGLSIITRIEASATELGFNIYITNESLGSDIEEIAKHNIGIIGSIIESISNFKIYEHEKGLICVAALANYYPMSLEWDKSAESIGSEVCDLGDDCFTSILSDDRLIQLECT